MAKNDLLACKLTEIGMAVSKFEDYPEVVNKAKAAELALESDEDVSEFILPTLRRFERLAYKFFHYPKLAKAVTKIMSKEVTYNAIPGLLMPDLVERSLAKYHITVFRKS